MSNVFNQEGQRVGTQVNVVPVADVVKDMDDDWKKISQLKVGESVEATLAEMEDGDELVIPTTRRTGKAFKREDGVIVLPMAYGSIRIRRDGCVTTRVV